MTRRKFLFILPILSILLPKITPKSTEFRFELPDKEEACFYEDVEPNTQITFEFEVVTGGKLDVDASISDPKGITLFEAKRKRIESHQFLTNLGGAYKFCFANKFSTFTHKVVFFQLEVGDSDDEDEKELFPDGNIHIEAYSTSESQLHSIHQKLKNIMDYQQHHKNKEAGERRFSEDLKERVQLWSLLQFSIMIAVSLLQVMIVRSFFSAAESRAQGSIRSTQAKI